MTRTFFLEPVQWSEGAYELWARVNREEGKALLGKGFTYDEEASRWSLRRAEAERQFPCLSLQEIANEVDRLIGSPRYDTTLQRYRFAE